ncbi:MAG: hypothetical protein GY832_11320 [Chloroflexi bacterium]|nr:hypothetical protein [Chloroflexota bacterium]
MMRFRLISKIKIQASDSNASYCLPIKKIASFNADSSVEYVKAYQWSGEYGPYDEEQQRLTWERAYARSFVDWSRSIDIASILRPESFCHYHIDHMPKTVFFQDGTSMVKLEPWSHNESVSYTRELSQFLWTDEWLWDIKPRLVAGMYLKHKEQTNAQ